MKKQVLFIVMMLMPLIVSANPVKINGIYYELIPKAKVAEVSPGTSNSTNYTGNIVIPSTVEYENVSYSVTAIGNHAFNYCSALTSVTLPNSITHIKGFAFAESGLTTVTIPNSVVSIGSSAFNGCVNLSSIKVETNNTVFDSRNECNAIIKTSTNELVAGCKNTIIPNSVILIGNKAFEGCRNLTTVDIPNSVVSIGECAFYGCSGLTSMIIPNSVVSVGRRTFFRCSSLTSLTISNKMTSLEESVFENCSNLKTVIIPESVTSIGQAAFGGCSNLTSISIPNSVTYIGGWAFSNCSTLNKIVIGSGVKSIGNKAFQYCNNLIEVKCFAANIPNTSSDAFLNSMIEYATLYVEHSINDYQTTKPWSEFGTIVSFTPIFKIYYVIDGEEYKIVEYEKGEAIMPEQVPIKEGYYFSGWSEIPETMPAHDVTVTGSFLLIPQCAKPTITFLANGKVKAESATEGATCVTNITASNAEPLSDEEISLNTPLIVYTVTSYATKEGYNDSEVATATFRYEKAEGDINGDGNLNISDVVQLVNMILGQ